MKFTQQQLLQAARSVGRGRESFTTAELREQLKVSTKDRQKLNQFYRSFRALQTAENEIEKLGPNCYRLRALVEERTVEVDPSELSEVSGMTALVPAPAPTPESLASAVEALPESVDVVSALPEAEQIDELLLVPEAEAIDELPAPAVVLSWRERLGSRMRSWFGGAGAAAQA